MKISFWPTTRLGKWAVGCMLVVFLSYVSLYLPLVFDPLGLAQPTGGIGQLPLYALLLMLLIALFLIVAFVTGLGSLLTRQERSILVYGVVGIGLLVLLVLP